MNKLEFHCRICDALQKRLGDKGTVTFIRPENESTHDTRGTWKIAITFLHELHYEAVSRCYDSKNIYEETNNYTQMDVDNAVHLIMIDTVSQFSQFFWGNNNE